MKTKISTRIMSVVLAMALVITSYSTNFTALFAGAASGTPQQLGTPPVPDSTKPFDWKNATVYFAMTDRFLDGDAKNNNSYGRNMTAKTNGTAIDISTVKSQPATFHGGDIVGITNKIKDNYFNDLGVNAIWITAPYEQMHGYLPSVDSGVLENGKTPNVKGFPHYSYHGYYPLDYTEMDKNVGTAVQFAAFVETAHAHGIRVVMDVVMNHTGYPNVYDAKEYGYGEYLENWKTNYYKTDYDTITADDNGSAITNEAAWAKWWGSEWVRVSTGYKIPGYTAVKDADDAEPRISCSAGLPDFKTEETNPVTGLPPILVTKWTAEDNATTPKGTKLTTETDELNLYFAKTGKPRTVRNHLVKWLTDWVRQYGIDGFRCDTAKHVDLESWKELSEQSDIALNEWRANNPTDPASKWTDSFYMTGEVFGHQLTGNADYYAQGGFDSLINFDISMRGVDGLHSNTELDGVYAAYSTTPQAPLTYISSHDTQLYNRKDLINAATKFLLYPGAVQIYYGDETARPLGWENRFTSSYHDQKLRTDMNWDDIVGANAKQYNKDVLAHWQKMGTFRSNHIAVGKGVHKQIAAYDGTTGYTFSRTDAESGDAVIVNMLGKKNIARTITVPADVFPNGTVVRNAYDSKTATVTGGKVTFNSGANGVILIESTTLPVLVYPSQKGGDFVDSLELTLTAKNLPVGDKATYSIDFATPAIEFTTGTKITIGETAQIGEPIYLTLKAGDKEQEYIFTKRAAKATAFIKNVPAGWTKVYCYVFNTKDGTQNKPWPGVEVTNNKVDGLYYFDGQELSTYEGLCVIFNNGGSGAEEKKTIDLPFDRSGSFLYDYTCQGIRVNFIAGQPLASLESGVIKKAEDVTINAPGKPGNITYSISGSKTSGIDKTNESVAQGTKVKIDGNDGDLVTLTLKSASNVVNEYAYLIEKKAGTSATVSFASPWTGVPYLHAWNNTLGEGEAANLLGTWGTDTQKMTLDGADKRYIKEIPDFKGKTEASYKVHGENNYQSAEFKILPGEHKQVNVPVRDDVYENGDSTTISFLAPNAGWTPFIHYFNTFDGDDADTAGDQDTTWASCPAFVKSPITSNQNRWIFTLPSDLVYKTGSDHFEFLIKNATGDTETKSINMTIKKGEHKEVFWYVNYNATYTGNGINMPITDDPLYEPPLSKFTASPKAEIAKKPITLATDAEATNTFYVLKDGTLTTLTTNADTKTATWTPADTGSYTLMVKSTYANGKIAGKSSLKVLDYEVGYLLQKDVPPTITTPQDAYSVYVGDTLAFDVTASDLNNDTITYTMAGSPATVGTLTDNKFSFTPTTGNIGTHTVTFTATSKNGNNAAFSRTATVTIHVAAKPVPGRFHFYSPSGEYGAIENGKKSAWKLHYWLVDANNTMLYSKDVDYSASSTGAGEFGRYFDFVVPGNAVKMGYIVYRLGEGNAWVKSVNYDAFVDVKTMKKAAADGVYDIYNIQNTSTIYFNETSALEPHNAYYDGTAKKVIFTKYAIDATNDKFKVSTKPYGLASVDPTTEATFSDNATDKFEIGYTSMDVSKLVDYDGNSTNGINGADLVLTYNSKDYPVDMSHLFNQDSDNNGTTDYYEKLDTLKDLDSEVLGSTYSLASTTFAVWAPTASDVKVNLYTNGKKGNDADKSSTTVMTKDSNGVWKGTANGNILNRYYTYSVTTAYGTHEVADIYGKAAGVNGDRSMVVDLADTNVATNPTGWDKDLAVRDALPAKAPEDSIIWEVHVRDFSIDASSGVPADHQGKYLAFTDGTTVVNGTGTAPTCVNYLKQLGVTHVHLLPVYDYASVNEDPNGTINPGDPSYQAYNWGYDPKSYNVPEGSYATDAANGNVRIIEFKQMVKALHSAGIKVIMDVVYNHTYATTDSFFQLTVPDYYYRKAGGNFLNASGCGNETASNHEMFRKFMVDSVLYWADEYHIDGFRFDLMAIHDVETMNTIRAKLNTKYGDNTILMYGEGWAAGDVGLTNGAHNSTKPADKANVNLMPGIAEFNDVIRDTVKGEHSFNATTGFVNGGTEIDKFKAGIEASVGSGTTGRWVQSSNSVITYTSAHDNLTLWDKLVGTKETPANDDAVWDTIDPTKMEMNKMAGAIILTSHGIPFMQAGEEFGRSKNGNENSYNSPDIDNHINWSRIDTHKAIWQYYKGMIEIRKAFGGFTNVYANGRVDNSYFYEETNNLIAYTLTNTKADQWSKVAVAMNNTDASITTKALTHSGETTPTEKWVIIANGTTAGLTEITRTTGNMIEVPANSVIVAVDAASYDAQKKYNITLPAADAKGNVVTADLASAKEGAKVTLTVAPAAGYVLKNDSLKVNNGSVTLKQDTVDTNKYTFTMPKGEVTVTATFEEKTYTVTPGTIQNGSVTIAGIPAKAGATVTLTPVPASGYQYKAGSLKAKWDVNGTATELTLTESPTGTFTFTMPAGNVTVTAEFTLLAYAVTIDSAIQNGTVTANPMGGAKGTTITLAVTPLTPGYEVDTVSYKLNGTGEPVPITGTSFNMPEGNVTVSATFKKTAYTVTASPLTGGTIGIATAPYTAGDTVTLTPTADSGYQYKANSLKATWGSTATELTLTESPTGTFTFIMPAGGVTVTATFDKVYTVTVPTFTNGSVTANPTSGILGTEITLTVSAAAGYKLTDGSLKAKYDTNQYVTFSGNTFQMPAGDVTIEAAFEVLPAGTFTITQAAGVTNGSITINPTSAKLGDNVTVTPVANEGYEYVAGSLATTPTATIATDGTFTMLGQNVTVTATFQPKTYNITKGTSTNGTINVASTAKFGDEVPVTVTAITDKYQLKELSYTLTNGTKKVISNGKFTMPSDNITISAIYELIPVTPTAYTVTIGTQTNGTVTATPNTGVSAGTAVTVTATPNTGYELEKLTYKAEGGSETEFSTSNPTFNMPAGNVTINATFKLKTYSISCANTTNGSISAKPTAAYNSDVTVTVTPNAGFELETLTYTVTGGSPVDIKSTKTFQMPAGNVTIDATFKKLNYTITVIQAPTNGTITPSKTPAQIGDVIKINVVPAKDYHLATLTYQYGSGAATDIMTARSFTMPAGNVIVTGTFEKDAVVTTTTAESTTTTTTTTPADSSSSTTTTVDSTVEVTTPPVTDAPPPIIIVPGTTTTVVTTTANPAVTTAKTTAKPAVTTAKTTVPAVTTAPVTTTAFTETVPEVTTAPTTTLPEVTTVPKEVSEAVSGLQSVVSSGAAVKEDVDVVVTAPITLPQNVISEAKEAGINIIIRVNDNNGVFQYSWEFDHDTVLDPKSDIDLGISVTRLDNALNKAMQEVAGEINDSNLVINYSHEGKLPGKVHVDINVSERYEDGTKLFYYYLNKDLMRLELLKRDVVVKDGNALLDIYGCSEYLLSDELIKGSVDMTAWEQERSDEVDKQIQAEKEQANLPSNPSTGISISLGLLSITVLAGVLTLSSKKRK